MIKGSEKLNEKVFVNLGGSSSSSGDRKQLDLMKEHLPAIINNIQLLRRSSEVSQIIHYVFAVSEQKPPALLSKPIDCTINTPYSKKNKAGKRSLFVPPNVFFETCGQFLNFFV